MFITFEGIEGSGKSTQIKMLENSLREQGYDVVLTREPGGPPISEQIRKILVDAKNSEMVAECEVLLYYAARSQHLQEWIKPYLSSNKIVLCDRFVDATIAYQGYGRGLSLEQLEWLSRFVLKDFCSDLTILFDLDVRQGLERAKSRANKLAMDQREDRFEHEEIAFHQAVRDGYLKLAAQNSQRFRVVDAALNKQELHSRILKLVLEQMASATKK